MSSQRISFYKFWFYLTLITFPLMMPENISSIMPFNAYGKPLAFIPASILIVLYLFELILGKEKLKQVDYTILLIIFALGLYSILMGTTIDGYGNEPIKNTLSHFLYPIYSFFLIFSIAKGFNLCNNKSIHRIFNYYSIVFIVVSFFQLLALSNNTFATIYDKINFLGLFRSSEFLISNNRICGFFAEPSYVAPVICCFLIPFYIIKYKTEHNKKSLILCFILLILSILCKSSTVYISLGVLFLILIIYAIKNSLNKGINKKYFIVSSISLIAIMLVILTNWNTIYMYIYKLNDLCNMSTAYRYSVVYNDINIFKNHIFGVGNGNQGYFYNEIAYLFSASNSYEIENALNLSKGVIGGGPFWGVLISGYGIVGILVILYLLHLLFKKVKYCRFNYTKKLFVITFLTYAALCTVAENIGLNIFFGIWFSLIFVNKDIYKKIR